MTIYEMSVEVVAVGGDVTAHIVLVRVAEAVASDVNDEDDVVEQQTVVVAAA